MRLRNIVLFFRNVDSATHVLLTYLKFCAKKNQIALEAHHVGAHCLSEDVIQCGGVL